MKTLIVYYSRSGWTRKVAKELAGKLECDIEEIKEDTNRSGIIGWLKAGRETMQISSRKKEMPPLLPLEKNLADYDLVVVGAPVWVGQPATPVQSFLSGKLDEVKDLAFFCTLGGRNPDKTFGTMQELSGKAPVATAEICAKDIKAGVHGPGIEAFAKELKDKGEEGKEEP